MHLGCGARSISSDLTPLYAGVLAAVRKLGCRAIVHTDWCELALDPAVIPDNVFLLCRPPAGVDPATASMETVEPFRGTPKADLYLALKPRRQIALVNGIPHDWLFPQLRAVVHHGGAGTTKPRNPRHFDTIEGRRNSRSSMDSEKRHF